MTAPGMFSPEHADPGSRRLAEALAGRLAGRVADLGAGWGWLARAALARNPEIAELDLHEAELAGARRGAGQRRRPAGALPLERRDRGSAPAAPPYDAVIINPPFHQGRAAEPDLGAAFIAAAARILKPHGRLMMVANRQLPYEAALDAAFRRWSEARRGRAATRCSRPRGRGAAAADCRGGGRRLWRREEAAHDRSRRADRRADPLPVGHAGGGRGDRAPRGAARRRGVPHRARRPKRHRQPLRPLGRAGPVLGFNGHTDVVPPGEPALAARPVRGGGRERAASTGAARPT